MGPYLGVRLWLKESATSERLLTGAVFSVVLALVVWAVVPDGSPTNLLTTAAAPPVEVAGDVAGGSADGRLEPTGARADERAAATGTPTPSASARTPNAPSTSEPAPPTLGATDQGVTASSIKIGFTITDLANASERAGVGIAFRSQEDTRKALLALVADVNDRGGILGRRLEAVIHSVDNTDANDQRAKCLRFTEEEKVFAVFDNSAFVFSPARSCVTVEHRTPLLTAYGGAALEYRRAYPYLISLPKDDNRKTRDMVFAARDSGFFDAAKGFRKLGIFTDSCTPTAIDDADGLKAYLREVGVREWSEFRTACDVASWGRAGPSAMVQHRRDGVTHVLLVTTLIGARGYLSTAQSSGWKPRYFASDYWNLTRDEIARDFDPNQFDRTQAVSMYHHGDPTKEAAVQPCSEALRKRDLEPIRDYAVDAQVLMMCDSLQVFVRSATAVGPQLTREIFGRAVSTSGEYRSGFTHYSNFNKSGKTSGGDMIAPVEWRRECRCWHQIGDFRAAHG